MPWAAGKLAATAAKVAAPVRRPPARARGISSGIGILATAALLALAAPALAGAQASLAYAPCEGSNLFACAHLSVPLDPSGRVPGSITLALRRHLAPVGPARSAVIALAGGPGQAAIPFTEEFVSLLGPILATRDLIVFDQRGTGRSDPLSCHAFETSAGSRALGAVLSACAHQLGPARAFYTSEDTVADIEAIRAAGGYEKLVLYGTSYGTKVAELYAELHPEHVEALVLDSVVTPTGPDPLSRASLAAIPRVLRAVCADGDCAGITRHPVGDLVRVVDEMRQGPLRGRVIGDHGGARSLRITPGDLLDILLTGDFSGLLRAELVTAVRAAAEHDNAPLARLLARVQRREASEEEAFDTPLYYATTCEEELFPWRRSATPAARLAEAKAAIAALAPSVTSPFGMRGVLALGDLPGCAFWPFATPAPPMPEGRLPDVPTLVLSGAEDLRTPTANARAVAGAIPDAHLLVVPDTGHSVLTTEPTQCARRALLALFAGRPIRRCRASRPPAMLRPPPLPPLRLADVAPASGYRGRTGRTLRAVALTLEDLGRQLDLALGEAFQSGDLTALASLRSGALRAGWASYSGGIVTLHGYSYIPGVYLSGTIGSERASLRIDGAAASAGRLHLGAHHTLAGTLAGEPVRTPSPGAAGSRSAARIALEVSAGAHPQAARARRALAAAERALGRLPLAAANP